MTSPLQQPAGPSLTSVSDEQASQCWLSRVSTYFKRTKNSSGTKHVYPPSSQISQARRDASIDESFFDAKALSQSDIAAANEKGKTILYLAYGSNLCNETFRGKRGIRPLSQINVLVPSLRLTFDLPGVPYLEPCFANTALRDPDAASFGKRDYHKDRWHKGLVGCVYEVTPSDYAHIIATEGGGAGYQDILVDCYPLEEDDTVPDKPKTPRFVAHTLFAPAEKNRSRPDPSYAQPSARYLNLITTGATELALPKEYKSYLDDIRPYTITTKRQKMGMALFAAVWLPFLMFMQALSAKFQDDKGRSPEWLANLVTFIFTAIWKSYDAAFKKVFGDGERTEGDEALVKEISEEHWRKIGMKNGWLHNSNVIEGDAV